MRNAGYTYRDRIRADAAGRTVLTFYAERYRHSTAEEWRARIEGGLVTLDGRPAHAHEVLAAGQRLAYRRPPWDEPDVPTEFGVLHEDEDLVVFDKPAGLPVLPGAGCLERSLLHLARVRHGAGLSPVHRLGRGTSGAVAFARTPAAARSLTIALRERRVEKTYLARVDLQPAGGGATLPDRFTISEPIGEVGYPPLGVVFGATPDGKPAVTHGVVLRRGPVDALVSVRIETGRAHQIRIHLAWAGWPLVGEPLYGPGGRPRPVPEGERVPLPGDIGFRLHAWRLGFLHPVTRQWLEVTAPPPPDLRP